MGENTKKSRDKPRGDGGYTLTSGVNHLELPFGIPQRLSHNWAGQYWLEAPSVFAALLSPEESPWN